MTTPALRGLWQDRFIPQAVLLCSEDARRRARILVGFCFALSAVGAMFALLAFFAYRLPLVGAVTSLATVAVFSAPLVFRVSGSADLAAHLVCLAVVFPTLVIAGSIEGLTSPALSWLAVAPLLSAVIATRPRVGVVWALVAVLGMGALFALDRVGLLPNHELDPITRRFASGMSYASLVVVVLAWVMINESLRARANRELQLAREQAMLSERLAALGTLAAGVAHEINNPLAYVLGNAQLAAETLRGGGTLDARVRAELADHIREIAEGSGRVRDIVTDLRTFSRGEEDGARSTELWPVIDSCIRLLGFQLRRKARVIREVGATPAVAAAASRLGQVFVNLLANAVQAMPDRLPEENTIRISTSTGPLGEAVIEVEDNGEGIPPQLQERIFDPFFTTRQGSGTGLGLAICHAIVTGVGGRLELESQVGRGTLFRLHLPPAEAPVAPQQLTPPPPPREAEQRRPRVMVIDDEPTLCAMAERALEGEFEVVSFYEPTDALDRLLHGEGQWDLILCDVMMPLLRGDELIRRAQARHPDLPHRLIYMTGGTLQERSELVKDGARLLLKPFDLGLLRRLAREVTEDHQQRQRRG
ncbi:MAG: ATP-binding protein [Myxococcota bacterium]|nr:ATP-binding protein [Myxococcota bacterium]